MRDARRERVLKFDVYVLASTAPSCRIVKAGGVLWLVSYMPLAHDC